MKELHSVKDIAAVRDSQAWFISFVAEYEYMRPRGEDDSPFRLNLGYETSLSPGEPHSNCPLSPSLACLYYLPSGREKTQNRRTITGLCYITIRIASFIDLANSMCGICKRPKGGKKVLVVRKIGLISLRTEDRILFSVFFFFL